jgi:hypothetical protein
VERQEFGSGTTPAMETPSGANNQAGTGSIQDVGPATVGSGVGVDTPFAQMMNYSEDELAVLAESFFPPNQNQNPEGGQGWQGNGAWWNMRTL